MSSSKVSPAEAAEMIDEGVKLALGTLFINWLAQAQGGAAPADASAHMQQALGKLFWLRSQAVAAVNRDGFLLLNLEELPIISSPQYDEENRRECYRLATEEGRTARLCDLPVTRCPPFKDNDLVISWKMGWRHEDERIAARKAQRSTGETLKCPACGTTLTMTDGFRPKK